MDYEVGPWKMAFFHGPTWWSNFQGPISSKINYEAFGPLTRCKLHVDQEEWPCTQKWMCWFFLIYAQKGQFKRIKSSLTILLSSLLFIFSSPKNMSLKIYYTNIFCHGPLFFFYYNASFASHCKSYYTMLVDNVGLKICPLGTSNSMVTLTFIFPWCKQKWSWDKFNNQLQIL
jgi:hypothetical protein